MRKILFLLINLLIACPAFAESISEKISEILRSKIEISDSSKKSILKINNEESYYPIANKDGVPSEWIIVKNLNNIEIFPSSDGNDLNPDIQTYLVDQLNLEPFVCADKSGMNVSRVFKVKEKLLFKYVVFQWQGGTAMADLKIILTNNSNLVSAESCEFSL
jgi:hypothetical protein